MFITCKMGVALIVSHAQISCILRVWLDCSVWSMEEFCIDPEIRLPSVTDRYYTKYYSLGTTIIIIIFIIIIFIIIIFIIIIIIILLLFFIIFVLFVILDTKGRPNEDQCVLQHSNKFVVDYIML